MRITNKKLDELIQSLNVGFGGGVNTKFEIWDIDGKVTPLKAKNIKDAYNEIKGLFNV